MTVNEYVTELLRVTNIEAGSSFTGYSWAITYDVTDDCHYLQLNKLGSGVLVARALLKRAGVLQDFHTTTETLAAQILLRKPT